MTIFSLRFLGRRMLRPRLFKRYICVNAPSGHTYPESVKGTAEPECVVGVTVLTQPENDEIYESVHGRRTKFSLRTRRTTS